MSPHACRCNVPHCTHSYAFLLPERSFRNPILLQRAGVASAPGPCKQCQNTPSGEANLDKGRPRQKARACHRHCRGNELYDGIEGRESAPAGTTSAPLQEPAQQGDQLHRLERVAAMRTGRSAQDDGLPPGQAQNQRPQEAPDNQSDRRGQEQNGQRGRLDAAQCESAFRELKTRPWSGSAGAAFPPNRPCL